MTKPIKNKSIFIKILYKKSKDLCHIAYSQYGSITINKLIRLPWRNGSAIASRT